MKTEENAILKITKNKVDFFLCKKIAWDINDIKLSKQEIDNLSSIQNPSRKIEFLGVRYLKNQFDPKSDLSYLKNGKPILNNSKTNVSISHSRNFVAFATAPFPIGIDIEECNDRIKKVKDRFLNENEKQLFEQNEINQLTIAWCAKESMFKLNEDSGLKFKTDILINEWDKISTIHASMKQNMKWIDVKLHFEIIDNLVLCFNFE
jgi:4'-phosphopantetheinyl transferase EntD